MLKRPFWIIICIAVALFTLMHAVRLWHKLMHPPIEAGSWVQWGRECFSLWGCGMINSANWTLMIFVLFGTHFMPKDNIQITLSVVMSFSAWASRWQQPSLLITSVSCLSQQFNKYDPIHASCLSLVFLSWPHQCIFVVQILQKSSARWFHVDRTTLKPAHMHFETFTAQTLHTYFQCWAATHLLSNVLE